MADNERRKRRPTPVDLDALRRTRLIHGLSIAALAKAASLSAGHLAAVERGTEGLSPAALGKVAEALGVDPAILLNFAAEDQ